MKLNVELLKNKKTIIILALGLLLIGGIILINSDRIDKKVNVGVANKSNVNTEEKPPAPDTQSIKEKYPKLQIAVVSNEVDISNVEPLKNSDRIKVWIYSQPTYLGTFTVNEIKGVKKIYGIYEAIKNNNINEGSHLIAFTTESNDLVGYIEVAIDKNSNISAASSNSSPTSTSSNTPNPSNSSTSTPSNKESEQYIEEKIPFSSRTENEINQARGTTRVSQTGQEGIRRITYKIVTDGAGKQISRTKISERITKQPVEQITKIGISDYNLNDNIKNSSVSGGLICLASDYLDYGIGLQCPEQGYGDPNKSNRFDSFTLVINGSSRQFVYCVGAGCGFELINIKPAVQVSGKDVTLSGLNYKIDERLGAGPNITIGESFCSKYGLACGRW